MDLMKEQFAQSAHADSKVVPQCPCCAGGDFRARFIGTVLRVHRCRSCGYLAGEFEVAAGDGSGYDRINSDAYEKSIDRMRLSEAEELSSLVVRSAPMPKTWLDFGCGAGRILEKAVDLGFTPYAIETDALAQQMARENVSSLTIADTLEGLCADAESFGVVTMLDVLEHVRLDDISQLTTALSALTSKKGVWVIKVPSTDGIFFKAAHAVARVLPNLAMGAIERLWLLKYPSPHYSYFNSRNLSLFLTRYGLEVLSVKYLPTVPFRTAYARLTLDPSIPAWRAMLMLPFVALLNLVERIYGVTDSLVVVARRVHSK